MITFDELQARAAWRTIPNCPGRFVMATGPSAVSPRDLVDSRVPLTEHRVPAARDPVIVGCLPDGGLISYRRANGTYVHTLNTRDGFARKLEQLGIR